MRPILIFILFLLSGGFMGCNDTFVQRIPYAPVYVRIDLNTARDQNLAGVGSTVFYTTANKLYQAEQMGFAGVIVFHTFNTEARNTYAAFDRACPVEAEKGTTLVRFEADKLKCNKCGSVFEIGFGTGHPISGPANKNNYYLQPYGVRIISEREMEVRN